MTDEKVIRVHFIRVIGVHVHASKESRPRVMHDNRAIYVFEDTVSRLKEACNLYSSNNNPTSAILTHNVALLI